MSTSAVTHLFRQSPHSGENVTTFFSGHTEFPCLIPTASYSIKIAQVEKQAVYKEVKETHLSVSSQAGDAIHHNTYLIPCFYVLENAQIFLQLFQLQQLLYYSFVYHLTTNHEI